ncbi:MAG TPA: class I SAM-dependent methyltransferase [Gemmataceae bacterium]|jgi:ubiquinone/menaquinone biosynthesis C-methylase UbiE|nr:class I SAM-dependent methyltransferase [Gemmataceae bacterium]
MNYMDGRLNSADRRVLQTRTAAHYDAYPFEFLTPENEISIRNMQPAPFRSFVDSRVTPGATVAEIGCGPGRGTLFLVHHPVEVVAVDISHRSLVLARQRAPRARFVLSTNLALPFESHRFDIVVSDGVLHHTPDPRIAFAEIARITKIGGHVYLGLYNRRGHYYYAYSIAGVPIRWLDQTRLGRIVIFGAMIPLYWLAHLVKSRGRRTWRGAVNFFYDYFVTPRASFHTYEEVCNWAGQEGLDLIDYDPSLGNVHVFVLRKNERA